ncbi:MAG: DUF6526 family protein [Candidatus Sulfotelmatobacter sp.]
MAEKKPQTFANHARLDPLFHFFVLPVFGLSTLAAVVLFLWHPSLHSAWRFVLIAAGTVAVFKIRLYALRVQDRVIRLEERLRLASLLPESSRSRIPELTEGQLIALRLHLMQNCQSWPTGRSQKSFLGRKSRRRFKLGVRTTGVCDSIPVAR